MLTGKMMCFSLLVVSRRQMNDHVRDPKTRWGPCRGGSGCRNCGPIVWRDGSLLDRRRHLASEALFDHDSSESNSSRVWITASPHLPGLDTFGQACRIAFAPLGETNDFFSNRCRDGSLTVSDV